MQDIIQMIKQGKNPQQIIMSILEARMKGTPMGDNLIKLAKEGNTAEIEKIARNIVSQQGGNYDEEIQAFKKRFGF